ncbi:DNA polymerase ligase-domain-containing protein [Aspergillus venezuelensis]
MSNEATSRLSSLTKPISPPPQSTRTPSLPLPLPSLSALEAGKQSVTDGSHLQTISAHLRNHLYANTNSTQSPKLLPIDAWESLYTRNAHSSGRHFVIHQHDHPVAGPHYDLRLQFSETSSLSWSCMYGMPGDANSRRLNRNATETRVHCLWNHLIETGSSYTGSMIIWDTGEYEVLPDKPKYPSGSRAAQDTETDTDTDADTLTDESDYIPDIARSEISDSEKLRRAFQNGKIHLRLHGTRLPKNYTIFLHRDKSDHRSAPTPTSLLQKPIKKKRRRTIPKTAPSSTEPSESEPEIEGTPGSRKRKGQTPGGNDANHNHSHDHSDAEPDATENTDFLIRLNNAYPGSTNDIGSVHQRRWFIVLDRVGSGFVPEPETESIDTRKVKINLRGRKKWVRGVDQRTGENTGFDPFYVRGPQVERSVLTGRLGGDVLSDEGVEGFVPRRGWRAVLV